MVNNPNHDEAPEPIDSGEVESTPLPGNRPADNALRATAESDLNLSWQGGEGAADFLGLDQDMGRPEPVSINLDEIPLEPNQGSAGPLFAEQQTIPIDELEHEADPAQFQTAPVYADPETEEFVTYDYAEEAPAESVVPEVEDSNWLLDESENAEAVSGEPGYEDAADFELEVAGALDSSFSEESSSRSPMRLVLMASLVVLAAGGTWYLSEGPTLEQPVEVASVDSSTSSTAQVGDAVTSSSSVEATGSTEVSPTLEGQTTAEDAELLAELAGLITESEGGDLATTDSNAPTSELPETATDSTVAATTQAQDPTPADGDRVERVVQINTGEMVLLPDFSSSLRLASESELSMLWNESTIPFEKFEADKRVMTPRVGRVRVIITGDELFEGELYAVGEGHIWIDSNIGRIVLATASVHDVQQLSGDARSPELGGSNSQSLAGLPRVRVKGAGGNFYGKVVAREGNLVTLIPDSGGRIRLQSSEVEVVGRMRTSLVRAEVE